MKICVISFHCCPFSLIGGDGVGGMNVYIKELCSTMAASQDIKIDIFTRSQNPDMKRINVISPRLRVIHVKGGEESFFDRKEIHGFLPEFIDNIDKFIRKERLEYDLIYSHYWLSGQIGERIKNSFGLPLVHTYHTLGFLKKRALGDGELKIRLDTERRIAQVSDVIISSTWEEKRNLMEEYDIPSERVKVINPGVNENLFFPCGGKNSIDQDILAHDTHILLYVGRIEPVKGLFSLIKAIELMKHKNPLLYEQLKLIVIGGGRKDCDFARNREILFIQNEIINSRIQDKVLFLGSKVQSELCRYYSAADAVVVPSLYESFGLVVVEALACGTPVLVSRVGKMTNLVQEGKSGFSFEPNDPMSLAEVIVQFYLNKADLWEKEHIREHVINKFSWSKTALETSKVLQTLIGGDMEITTKFQPGGNPRPA